MRVDHHIEGLDEQTSRDDALIRFCCAHGLLPQAILKFRGSPKPLGVLLRAKGRAPVSNAKLRVLLEQWRHSSAVRFRQHAAAQGGGAYGVGLLQYSRPAGFEARKRHGKGETNHQCQQSDRRRSENGKKTISVLLRIPRAMSAGQQSAAFNRSHQDQNCQHIGEPCIRGVEPVVHFGL